MNIIVNKVYISNLEKYDSKMFEHMYLKKGSKFINIKSEKVVDIDEFSLIKLVREMPDNFKINSNDLSVIAGRYITKPNRDIIFETVRRSKGESEEAQLIKIQLNPYHPLFDIYKNFITNMNDLERLKKEGTGSCDINGIVVTDRGMQHSVTANFSYESAYEPMESFFYRRIKVLTPVKKFGLF